MESQHYNTKTPKRFRGLEASSNKKSISRKGTSSFATPSASTKPRTRSATALKAIDNRPDFVLQNQPVKRQKLAGGETRQILDVKPVTLPRKSRPYTPCPSTVKQQRKILDVKPVTLPHKARPYTVGCTPELCPSTVKRQRQEFHRTSQFAKAQTPSAASSTNALCQTGQKRYNLRERKTPLLQTSMRAQLFRVKGSEETKQEQVPKFKARPFNRKIFKGKGAGGVYTTQKHVVTEQHPFHFHTEERGMEKHRRLLEDFKEKENEERARIPKALPYPYSTDFPMVPPKREPKVCTRAEPFHLESVLRHGQELQRQIEYRQKMEQMEAQKRIFKAQPIMKEDPYPVPEKVVIPSTNAMDIELNVDYRAVERAHFDNMIKEKEIQYQRYKEERECAKMLEVEMEIKQLRKAMVPHARPLPYFDNPFVPQKSSKEPTIPHSPNWHGVQRKQKNVCSSSSRTTPASKMR